MITLKFKGAHSGIKGLLKAGQTIHLKILANDMIAPGRWQLTVEDVTPEPEPKE